MIARLLVSLLLVVVVWYVLRVILQEHPPAVRQVVDVGAAVFVLLIVLRYAGLL